MKYVKNKPIARNATPPLTAASADEWCECSRCGTIYKPADQPDGYFKNLCPGCWKRRTYKDRVFPTNPFETTI